MAADTVAAVAELTEIFQEFCLFGKTGSQLENRKQFEMDGRTLAKLAKDSQILSKKLTSRDVDLVFATVKTKGTRFITFNQFQSALKKFAQRKGVSYNRIVAQIVSNGGPKQHRTTKAQSVKFHDDKSMYTGVYKKENFHIPEEKSGFDLATFTNRKPADVRGVRKHTRSQHAKSIQRRATLDMHSRQLSLNTYEFDADANDLSDEETTTKGSFSRMKSKDSRPHPNCCGDRMCQKMIGLIEMYQKSKDCCGLKINLQALFALADESNESQSDIFYSDFPSKSTN